jgi:glycosyltransferase involved in cell wall biosynthesis
VKVLYANKYFFRKGGAEVVMLQEMEYMRGVNVAVIEFSMTNPQNIWSPYASSFVSERDYQSESLQSRIKSAATFIHSPEAVRKISDLIRAEAPDVLHCHNIYHQLTPSIIRAAVRLGVPVVLTLHDFKIVCPIYVRYRNGARCIECSRERFWPVVKHRCSEQSFSRSVLLWAEARYHSMRSSYELVAKIIAPSRYMRDSVAPWFGDGKVVHVPNGVDVSRIGCGSVDGGYVLFFGRISPEKGIETLLQAHAAAGNAWRLVVAGTGPLAEQLKHRYPLAEFTGHLGGDELGRLISEASLVVVSSECDENCPLSALEAMAYAKPVVASRVGGVPELVRDGETGLLFKAGDRHDLLAKIQTMLKDVELRKRFGRLGRALVRSEYSLESHGRTLLSIYEGLSRTKQVSIGKAAGDASEVMRHTAGGTIG